MASSPGLWKQALDSFGLSVWEWHVATGEESLSPSLETMLGFTAGELAPPPQALLELVHPDDVEDVRGGILRFLESSACRYTIDVRLRRQDGGWQWIEARCCAIERDAHGRPLRLLGMCTDIGEVKKEKERLQSLNQQLQENAELLETTLTSISQGIALVDRDGRIRKFNQRICELLDLPASLLTQRPRLTDLIRFQLDRGDFGPDAQLVDSQARLHMINAACAEEDALPPHYLRETRDGKTLEVRTQSLPSGLSVRTFADVTDYVQAKAAGEHLNQLLQATQRIARVGGWETDYLNDRVFWTDGIYRVLDLTTEEFAPSTRASVAQFFTPEAVELLRPVPPRDPAATVTHHDLEFQLVTAKNRSIWVHALGTISWRAGKPQKRLTVAQDITERKLAQAAAKDSEDRWKLALESTGDGVWDWYVQAGKEFFSPRLLQMCGYEGGDLDSRPDEFDQRTHPDDIAILQQARLEHFESRTPSYQCERRIRCKDGSWKWVLSRGMVINRDADGKPLRMIGTFTDMTDRKESEAVIRHQAFFDALTGLPNRRMLSDRLAQEIKKAKRDGLSLALLFMDLDHFKEVNDTLGHDYGDQLLIEAGRRIQTCVRESDTVARMGGDEFTVILAELSGGAHLEGILQKMLTALSAVFQLGTEQVYVSASIGIAVYPNDADHIENLLKHADQALYVAKAAGRNRFSFFTPALQDAAQTRVRLASDLRSALAERQFQVVYQPIIELASGAIHKAEALLRWHHPVRGTVSPTLFIPIAESNGLIVAIGEWVFEQAAQQVLVWQRELGTDFQISVNKSPVQFHHEDSGRASWALRLAALGLSGNSIAVEITEGLLLDASSGVADTLLGLRADGISVSLDDFGTGYSSLSYLQKFPIDFVKIDQSFVRNLKPGSTDLALCKAIVVMAHALGIRVIAEGVETVEQRDLLAGVSCDFAQGYLYAKPMPAPDFAVFVIGHRSQRPAPALDNTTP